MLKNQKGITMISLVVTIIILLILTTTVISTSVQLIKSSKVRNHITIMSLIKAEAEKIFENLEFSNDVSDMSKIGIETNILTTVHPGISKYNLESGKTIPIVSEDPELSLLRQDVNAIKDSNNDGTIEIDVDNLWYIWRPSTLKSLNINYDKVISDEQYFIINYATGEVIFPFGINAAYNDLVLYSLTGLKELDKE